MILEELDVVSSTIVVTDESGSIVFTEGIDYSIDELGRRTEIRRIPLGDIGEGRHRPGILRLWKSQARSRSRVDR